MSAAASKARFLPAAGKQFADRSPVQNFAIDGELATLARALAHPARVRILRILAGKKGCICGELVDALPLAQSTVSQHLKILKQAGLIRGEIDGPRICYCLAPEVLRRLRVLIRGL